MLRPASFFFACSLPAPFTLLNFLFCLPDLFDKEGRGTVAIKEMVVVSWQCRFPIVTRRASPLCLYEAKKTGGLVVTVVEKQRARCDRKSAHMKNALHCKVCS